MSLFKALKECKALFYVEQTDEMMLLAFWWAESEASLTANQGGLNCWPFFLQLLDTLIYGVFSIHTAKILG